MIIGIACAVCFLLGCMIGIKAGVWCDKIEQQEKRMNNEA